MVCRVLLLLSFLFCCRASSALADDVTYQHQSVVGGTATSRRDVVALDAPGPCTAVVVAPNLLITAQHCVRKFQGAGPYGCGGDGGVHQIPNDAGIEYVGAGLFERGSIPAESVHLRLGHDAPRIIEILVSGGTSICESDLAMLVLDRALESASIVPVSFDGVLELGQPLIFVGFGDGSPAGGAAERTVLVQRIGRHDDGDLPLQDGFFEVGEGVCRGDSGGPVIDASGSLRGVASTVRRNDDVSTGTSADCVGPVRGRMAATDGAGPFLMKGFEGAQQLPRSPGVKGLSVGAACLTDRDCEASSCLRFTDEGLRCELSCRDWPCGDAFECVKDLDGRSGCRPETTGQTMDAGTTPSRVQRQGCQATAGLEFWLLAVVLRRVRR